MPLSVLIKLGPMSFFVRHHRQDDATPSCGSETRIAVAQHEMLHQPTERPPTYRNLEGRRVA